MKSENIIRYDLIVQEAMLGVVKKVLSDAMKDGLVGEHHYYLTYETDYPGVEMPSHLLEKYPNEITIVLQHEFEDLKVTENGFSATLWFNNVPAHLTVPFKAIRAFFDPSVKFGLQFNSADKEPVEKNTVGATTESAQIGGNPKEVEKDETGTDGEPSDGDKKGNVISLDAFRKK